MTKLNFQKSQNGLPQWIDYNTGIMVYKPCDKNLFRVVDNYKGPNRERKEFLGKRFRTFKAAMAAAQKFVERQA
jgi:hypothetical protein